MNVEEYLNAQKSEYIANLIREVYNTVKDSPIPEQIKVLQDFYNRTDAQMQKSKDLNFIDFTKYWSLKDTIAGCLRILEKT